MRAVNELSSELKVDLEKTISQAYQDGLVAEVKVSVYDIPTGLSANVRGDYSGWAASIIKVPIMVATLEEIRKGNLSLESTLKTDHSFCLEKFDPVSRMPNRAPITVDSLLNYMIRSSDNEATNILANHIGISGINAYLNSLGLKKTMLGHLLCKTNTRYTSEFNPTGSNITTPNDMVKIFRQIYDKDSSDLDLEVQKEADRILSNTFATYLTSSSFRKSNVKSKIGQIFSDKDGSDLHEVGIIDDRLIVCLMANKIKREGWDYFLSDDEIIPDFFREMCWPDTKHPANPSTKEVPADFSRESSWQEGKYPKNPLYVSTSEIPVDFSGESSWQEGKYPSNPTPIRKGIPSVPGVYDNLMERIAKTYKEISLS